MDLMGETFWDGYLLCGLEFYWQERSWLGNLYRRSLWGGGGFYGCEKSMMWRSRDGRIVRRGFIWMEEMSFFGGRGDSMEGRNL